MLEELDIEQERTVKCNAHVCLAIEEAVDSVLLDTEVKVGTKSPFGKKRLSRNLDDLGKVTLVTG